MKARINHGPLDADTGAGTITTVMEGGSNGIALVIRVGHSDAQPELDGKLVTIPMSNVRSIIWDEANTSLDYD